jgi:hypothetical protein
MNHRKLYSIEIYWEAPLNRWVILGNFSCMQKSFAQGAWIMLKSYYNQNNKHRLLCDGKVIDEWGKAEIQLS